MGEFRMPSLGADMESGTIVEWKIHVGNTVKHGDVVAEVETEKGLIDIEIFEDGLVEEIVVKEGEKVAVGAVLAIIRGAGGAVSKPQPSPIEAAPVPAQEPALPSPAADKVESGRRHISPLARRRAAELGIDPATLRGSGEQGAVSVNDVERAAGAQPSPSRPSHKQPTADQLAAMARSKREIPHYYLATTIDMSRALKWLEAENVKRSVLDRLLPAVLLLRAVALAARQFPEMNGYWIDSSFQPADRVHLGVAISLRTGGLVAPAIHDADQMNVYDLARHLLDLVQRARSGRLRSSEVSDATLTVTNLGEQGVETVFGVIYPPQVALVGFGKIVEQPRAVQGQLGIHPGLTATLAADHRTSDGHRGGRFLATIDQLLQDPEEL